MLIKKGSRGPEVKKVQEFLGLSADGIFGAGTEAAVKQWQTKNGLTADGIVGPRTLKMMEEKQEPATPSLLIKNGSRGPEVKKVQELLGLSADGIFGAGTEAAVKQWQADNGLTADGIVGPKTLKMMETIGVRNENIYTTPEGLEIEKYFMPDGQYLKGPTAKEYLFLHHTAGWQNPFKVVDDWAGNSSQVCTEFVIGGQSVKGNNTKHDGKVVQCFPGEGYGWHLGDNGSQHMHTHSVGIEVCNFGFIENGKTYAGTTVVDSQQVTLAAPFRKHSTWHRYSDAQIESLRMLILHVGNRDNIDIRAGLVAEIKQRGADAFLFNEKAYYGEIKGMWTHTNTRMDKTDMFPQQELMDMLLSL